MRLLNQDQGEDVLDDALVYESAAQSSFIPGFWQVCAG